MMYRFQNLHVKLIYNEFLLICHNSFSRRMVGKWVWQITEYLLVFVYYCKLWQIIRCVDVVYFDDHDFKDICYFYDELSVE